MADRRRHYEAITCCDDYVERRPNENRLPCSNDWRASHHLTNSDLHLIAVCAVVDDDVECVMLAAAVGKKPEEAD